MDLPMSVFVGGAIVIWATLASVVLTPAILIYVAAWAVVLVPFLLSVQHTEHRHKLKVSRVAFVRQLKSDLGED